MKQTFLFSLPFCFILISCKCYTIALFNGTIIDKESRKPLENVTAEWINSPDFDGKSYNCDPLTIKTDSSGKIQFSSGPVGGSTPDIMKKGKVKLIISKEGYKTITKKYKGKNKSIYMTKG